MKKFIPNFLTLMNLFCGCVAVLFAVQDALIMAALFVGLGIFFDFFDGFVARILKIQSKLGVQLDSLADMVTSGLVPGIVMYRLLIKGFNIDEFACFAGEVNIYGLFGFLITLASCYRLAKFNIDDQQKNSFIGLPTPANTLLIVSFPLILEFQSSEFWETLILNPWFLIGLTLLSTYLLNAKIHLFALKFKSWGWTENRTRYIFLILAFGLLGVFKFVAIPMIILSYVLFSFLERKKNRI